jgi:hypothetical protein
MHRAHEPIRDLLDRRVTCKAGVLLGIQARFAEWCFLLSNIVLQNDSCGLTPPNAKKSRIVMEELVYGVTRPEAVSYQRVIAR